MASAPSTAPAKARKAQLARELGVSRQAIGDLVARGVLSEDKDGLIDVELAKLALQNRVRPSAKTARALTTPPAPATPPAADAPGDASAADLPKGDATVTSYHVAKTLNETAQARMNQLKMKEMQGDLIRVAVVEAVWGASLAAAREHLLQVRARIAPLLAAETDVFKIEQLLDDEFDKALRLLSGAQLRKSEGKG